MVIRRFAGVVYEWTTDVADCKTDVEDTGSCCFLGMAGGVRECPREYQRGDTLEYLQDEVDGKEFGLVLGSPGKGVQ